MLHLTQVTRLQVTFDTMKRRKSKFCLSSPSRTNCIFMQVNHSSRSKRCVTQLQLQFFPPHEKLFVISFDAKSIVTGNSITQVSKNRVNYSLQEASGGVKKWLFV